MTMTQPDQPRGTDPETGWDDGPAEFSPWSQLNVLMRQRWLILLLPAVFGVAGLVRAELATRKYLATAKFAPQDAPAAGAGLGQLASQLGVGVGRVGTNSPQFYADLVFSREILRRLVRTELERPSTGFKGDLIAYYHVAGATDDEKVERAVRAIRGNLSSTADRNNVVNVELSMDAPELALTLMHRLLELVNEFNVHRRQTQARAEREFVQQRVLTAKTDLNAAEDAVAEFFRRNRVSLAPDLQAQGQRLGREVALRQALYMQLSQSLETSRIEEVRATSLITVLERPDGFVVPQAKRALQKGILAAVLGLVIAIILAYIRDAAGRSREHAANDYEEFRRLRRQFFAELRQSPVVWLRKLRSS